MSDKRINEIIESGKKNLETMKLVNNWCENAQVIKTGGTGLIEMETGLPIGHHGLRCDHAPEGGLSTWHLADAIPDFYDKNCKSCTKRIPVSFPNILQIIEIRDARREKNRLENEAEKAKKLQEYTARKNYRISLSSSLSAISASLVDLVDELDRLRTPESSETFSTTAKIAPHAFTQEIIEYCFKLMEDEQTWFFEAGLHALNALNVDKGRLVACAMKCISSAGGNKLAFLLITQNPQLCQEDLIGKIMSSLIHLASHDRGILHNYEKVLDRKPLQEVYKANSKSVRSYLQKALGSKSIRAISLASRAIEILSEVDSTIAPNFSRDLAAKLLRAEILIDDFDSDRYEEIRDLINALVCAFNSEPTATDELLTGFIYGANPESEKRLFRLYDEVLRQLNPRFNEHKPISEAHRIAFNRMIWGAAKGHNFYLHTEVTQLLSHPSQPIIELASENIDAMFGCSLILNEEISVLENDKSHLEKSFLENMEYQNNLSALHRFRNELIACVIASIELTGNYSALLTFIEGLPEADISIRAQIVSKLHILTKTVDGLNAILPHFYSGLIGSSSLVRAYAAQTYSEISYNRRNDLPELAREAFLALLNDPYVIVHQGAVRALSRAHMPTEFMDSAKESIGALLQLYGQKREPDPFTIECIELYVDQFCDLKTLEGKIGDYFINLLIQQDPWRIAKDIHFWSRRLGKCSKFMDLLKVVCNDLESMSAHKDNIFEVIQALDAEFVQKNILSILEIAEGLVKQNSYTVTYFIEPLTRAQEWSATSQLTATTLANIPNTIRTKHQRLFASQWDLASKFEYKIQLNDFSQVDETAIEWGKISDELQKDAVNDRDNLSFGDFFS